MRDSDLHASCDECFRDRMLFGQIGDGKWPTGPMPGPASALLILAAFEHRQYVVVAPALVAEIAPAIVILTLATNIEETINRTRTAERSEERRVGKECRFRW